MTLLVNSVSKTFLNEGDIPLEVLRDINLNVPAASALAIMGRSGIGKTTLLRIIGDLLSPDAGSVERPSYLKTMSYVPQWDALLPWRNVIGNITLAGDLSGMRLDAGFVTEVIDTVGLTRFRDYYPHQLSGGMARRVLLARAIVMQPDLLLLDEPFSSLDYFSRLSLSSTIRRLIELLGCMVVFVTHEVDLAYELADKIVVISGRPAQITLEINSQLDGSKKTKAIKQLRDAILER